MSDNWVEEQLAKNPVLTIVIVASIGVAFLTGVGALRPVFQAGRWINAKLTGKSSVRPRTGWGTPANSRNSQSQTSGGN